MAEGRKRDQGRKGRN